MRVGSGRTFIECTLSVSPFIGSTAVRCIAFWRTLKAALSDCRHRMNRVAQRIHIVAYACPSFWVRSLFLFAVPFNLNEHIELLFDHDVTYFTVTHRYSDEPIVYRIWKGIRYIYLIYNIELIIFLNNSRFNWVSFTRCFYALLCLKFATLIKIFID